jgi:hypothetical protein
MIIKMKPTQSMKALHILLTAFLFTPLAALHAAEIKPANHFSANTVLQRDREVPVWGWADPNTAVTVEFADQKKRATANADGKWLVRLDPLPANSVPATLRISAAPAQAVSIDGVVVGDVFLCAGGSEILKRDPDVGALPGDSEAPPARVFVLAGGTSPEVQNDVSGRWIEARAFGDEHLPFFIVELRPHRYAVPFGTDGRLAAEMREAHRAAATKADATVVTTIDMGADPKPHAVAARIASAIEAKVFQKPDRDMAGPTLAKVETNGDTVTLHFTNTHGGLQAKGDELQGFAIASSLLRWVWADAKIEGDTVVLSAPTVPNPEGVRYAYEDLPSRGATLTDGQGHPAAPFRTDTHLSVSGANLDPGAQVLRYTSRADLGMEDPRLPRILIIGDSISGHYLYEVRELISTDLIHPKAEAKPLMAELIAQGLNETLATLPRR